MRIVWKDTHTKNKKPVKHRGFYAVGVDGGWATTIPGDTNIYKNHYCAMNAIDAYYGCPSYKGAPPDKRKRYGIQIIGQLKDTEKAPH